MTTTIQSIELNKLVPSAANVRHTDKEARVDELAASIAAHGLLQNLTVRPAKKGKGKKAEDVFEVIGGGRRLAALKLLAGRQQLAEDAPIPCNVRADGIAEELSLAENTAEPMHPADQFEAFSRLSLDHGMCAEDIAARFGVTASIVRQRLALAAVSPKLIEIYREGEMNLQQLSAFSITDDFAAQERVWEMIGDSDCERYEIIRMLGEDKVPAYDRRVQFVGTEAYLAAGGTMLRDLFDEEDGGYLTDPDLLNRLVMEKLEAEAATVAAEGWKWVKVALEYDYGMTAKMKRVFPDDREYTAEEAEKIRALELKFDAISEDDSYEDDEDAQMNAIRAVEAEIEAIAGPLQFRAEDIKRGGAFVTLGSRDGVRIERGFILAEDQTDDDARDNNEADATLSKPARDPSALSEKLVAELTSHRTAALRNELAQRTDIAFAALLHALVTGLFYSPALGTSCIRVSLRTASVEAYAPGIGEGKAQREIEARHDAWRKRLPAAADGLWGFIVALDRDDLLALLAHCVSLSVDAIQQPGQRNDGLDHADVLAGALMLDMAQYWSPTRDSYLNRVSKQGILTAVRDGISVHAAENMSGMKKQAMAEAAEQRLAGKGWLPPIMRTKLPQAA